MAVTEMQIIKPVARQLRARSWTVVGAGFRTCDVTLDGALQLWYACVLASQLGEI